MMRASILGAAHHCKSCFFGLWTCTSQRGSTGRGARGACARQGCLATSMGQVLCRHLDLASRAPFRMHLFGTAKGRNGPRAISRIMKWVPIVLSE